MFRTTQVNWEYHYHCSLYFQAQLCIYCWHLLWLDIAFVVPISQNGQTHSNNLSAICWQIVWVFGHFVGLVLKGLMFFIFDVREEWTWNISNNYIIKVTLMQIWKSAYMFVFM